MGNTGVEKEMIPDERDYNFKFNRDTCHKEMHGICPVIEHEDDIRKGTACISHCKCVRLIQDIINNGFVEKTRACWIEVSKNTDSNLYEISNGRHRICAASKLKVSIKVHVYE